MVLVKEINIKNRRYYFFGDLINIKNFPSHLLKIDKKSCKDIGIYYIGYITVEYSDYVKIKCVDTLYLMIDKVNGYIEEKTEVNI